MKRKLAIILSILALVISPASDLSSQASTPEFVPGQVLVKVRENADYTQLLATPPQYSIDVVKRFDSIGVELWQVSGITVDDMITQYASDPGVEYIEPNYIYRTTATPNDPRFSDLWGLHNTGQTGGVADADIDAPEAWDIGTGGDVLVGVIDTGVDWTHVDLAANIYVNPGEIPNNGIDDDNNGFVDDVRGWDFRNEDNNPMDDHSHGTHVSGTIGAVGNNGIGVVGVNWNVKIMPLKFLSSSGSGTTTDAIECVEYATMMGVNLTNNSWGGGGFSQALKDAIEAAGNAGILFVASSGNDASNTDNFPSYPASYDLDNIISVANTTHDDQLSFLSNFGAVTVDLGAPGSDVLSTEPNNSYGYKSGTSMAAPHVSGAVSLAWSISPGMPLLEVKSLVMETGDVIPALTGTTVSDRRLNIFNLLVALDSDPPAPIHDLSVVSTGSNTATLQWTATGDDQSAGTATAYDIRYSAQPINSFNFDVATEVEGEPTPQASGMTETHTVSGLATITKYYFAVVAIDETDNRSFMSNVADGTTLGTPVLAYNPMFFQDALHTGGRSPHIMTIRNDGKGTLDFSFPGIDPIHPSAPAMASSQVPSWVRISPESGRVYEGESTAVEILLDATGLAGGTYVDSVLIDNNDPGQPDAPMVFVLEVTDAADVSVNPGELNFEPQFINFSRTLQLGVSNIGTLPLDVSDVIVTNPEFTTDQTPFAVAPGMTRMMQVVFSPVTIGPLTGVIRLLTDDPDTPIVTIPLSGVGVDPPVMVLSPDSLSADLFTGEMEQQVLTITNDGGSDLDFTISTDPRMQTTTMFPSMMNAKRPSRTRVDANEYRNSYQAFEDNPSMQQHTRMAQTPDQELMHFATLVERVMGDSVVVYLDDMETGAPGWTHYATNPSGNDQWSLSSARAASGVMSWRVTQHNSIGADAVQSPQIDLERFDSATLTFNHWYNFDDCSGDPTFEPDGGIVEVSIDGGATWTQIFPFGGYPYVLDDICGNILAFFDAYSHDGGNGNNFVPAVFDLTPYAGNTISLRFQAGWDCGNCGVNEGWYVDDVTIYSRGVGWLELAPEEGTVPASSSLQVDVGFNAFGLAGGAYDAFIKVASNDPYTPRDSVVAHLDVTGAPDIAADPNAVDFGELIIGFTRSDTIQIKNVGTDVLSVSNVVASDGDYTADVASFMLAAGDTRDVAIAFAPSRVGAIPATLSFVSNDPDEPSFDIALTGVGLDPPVMVVSPESIADDLLTGDITTHTVTIDNAGTTNASDLIWSITAEQLVSTNQQYTLTAPVAGDVGLLDGAATGATVSRTTPITATLADLTGIDIMWDLSHFQFSPGGWSTILSDVTARGATVTENLAFITPALLSNFDILWTVDTNSWSPVEVTALVDWVHGGGSLIIESDESQPTYDAILTALASGITMAATGATNAITTNIFPHPATEDVAQVSIVAALASLSSVVAPAGRLVDDIASVGVVAYSQVQSGRVVVLADELLANGVVDGADNQLLGNRLVDWLGGAVNWLVVDPAAGAVSPGDQQPVSVTLDATGLFGGPYDANIIVNGNDPSTPQDTVAVHIDVTGAPDIAVADSVPDFGPLFVGVALSTTVTVANQGTDLLVVSDVSTDDGDYTVDISSFNLPPATGQDVVVTFAPTRVGPIPATLSITSNDHDEPVVTRSLGGEGVAPPVLGVSPETIADSLLTGGMSSHTVTISNTGGSALEWQAGVKGGSSQSQTLTLPRAGDVAALDGGAAKTSAPAATAPARTTAIAAVLGDLTGVNILWDSSHGQPPLASWSTITNDAIARGATVTENFSTITPGMLASYDLLWTTDCATWAQSEVSALVAWVHNGGGLIIESDQSVTLYSDILNALGSGLTLAPVGVLNGVTGNIFPHPTTAGVTQVQIPGALASITGIGSPGGRLVNDIADVGAVAYSETQRGRVVVVIDEMFADGSIGAADNQLFANQIVDWLAGSVHWLTLDPTAGVVTPGTSEELTVTLDASGLLGGLYEADITVTSNDPITPEDSVAVSLHVTGAPDIEVSTAQIDFAPTFIGVSDAMTFAVQNVGTENLIVSAISSSDADYTVDVNAFTVLPGASQDVVVTFSPTRTGPIAAMLSIESDDADTPVLDVALSGDGLAAPIIGVVPQSLVDSLNTGEASAHLVTISNTGGSDLTWSAAARARGAAAKSVALNVPAPGDRASTDGDVGPARAASVDLPPARDVAISATLADLTGVNIMWDRSHGQSSALSWSTIVADLTNRGATVIENFNPITQGVLSGFDMLWTIDCGPWSTPEIAELASWMQTGGALLIESDQATTTYNAILAALGSGIVVSSISASNGLTTNIFPHPTTDGITELRVPGALASLPGINAPAGRLVDDFNDVGVVAYSVIQSGRLVVASDELFSNFGIGIADNQLFGNMVVDWLAGTLAWLSLDATSGVVAPGASEPVSVTMDAAGLQGGLYEADIVINSNDPLTPETTVSVDLDVTGAPNIVLSPDQLNFGSVFVGASATDTILVSNNGTDDLVVSSITTDNADYTVDVSNFMLSPGTGQVVSITFAPAAAGQTVASVTVASNDPDEPSVSASLMGVGAEPPVIGIAPQSLQDSLFTGDSSAHIVTITNSGASDLEWTVFPQFSTSAVVQTSPVFTSHTAAPDGRKDDVSEAPARPAAEELYSPGEFGRREYAPAGVTAAVDATPTVATPLEDLLAALNDDFASVTSIIPFRFDFFEGIVGTSIGDGGFDMYDGGNILWTNSGGPVTYSDNLIVDSTIFGPNGRYFTRKYPGLFVMVADTDGITEFMITGNLGADGSGSADGAVLQATVNGTDYLGFVKRVFNAGDPSVNHLIIVESTPAVTHTFSTNTDDDFHSVSGLGDVDQIYYALYAGTGGFYIDNTATLAIMTQFLTALDLSPNWVSAQPTSGVVTPGGSSDVTVALDATGLIGGLYQADLIFASNDPITPQAAVPVDLDVTGASNIVVADSVLEFNSVFIGLDLTKALSIGNDGTDVLVVTNIASDDSDYTAIPTGFALAPGEATNVQVTFAPSRAGDIPATLSIASNDPNDPVHTVTLNGVGITPTPEIAVSDSVLDFGLAFVGIAKSVVMQVANVGTGVLSVSDITTGDSDFSAAPSSFDLAIGQTQDVQVTLIASAPGNKATTMNIASNAAVRPNVEVSLVANAVVAPTIEVVPDSISVALAIGEVVIDSMLIANTGGSDLTWDIDVSLAGMSANGPSLLTADGPADVMFHGDHGFGGPFLWSTIIGDIEARGATVTEHTGAVTAAVLSGVETLWLGNTMTPLTGAELVAISNFVHAGGGLLIESDNNGSNYSSLMGELGSVKWLGGPTPVSGGVTPNVFPHQTTANVSTLMIPSPGQRVNNVAPLDLLFQNLTFAIIGAKEDIGAGRVMLISDQVFLDTVVDQEDNRLFGNQAFDWLLGALGPQLAGVSPSSGTVAAGDNVMVTLTIDASTALIGTYDLDINVDSNDPATPQVTVPLSVEITSVTTVTGLDGPDTPPVRFGLSQNYPNPFNPTTVIPFEIAEASDVRVIVYNISGQRVIELVNERRTPGRYKVTWDGRNQLGDRVASGVYFYRMTAGNFVQTKKMIVLK